MSEEISRRFFCLAALALPVFFVSQRRAAAEATPACSSDETTPDETEGPFFKPRSPERRSFLEPGLEGRRLVLSGRVMTTGCVPVSRAVLDFWHADASGEYDNVGFRLRGHQFTDDEGGYRLETIVPGVYPGRTRHVHVKVYAPKTPILTTQLYFPGEVRNRSDGLFRQDLLVNEIDAGETMRARFDFVVAGGDGFSTP
jgi:protocatechuate 3,4-dioxygenase beta subunit